MSAVSNLLAVSEAYRATRGISASRLSTIVFGDGKVLPQLALETRDITTRRLEAALAWFAANWPEGAVWPAGVPRPDPAALPAAAEPAA